MNFMERRLIKNAIINRNLDELKKLTTERVENPDSKEDIVELYRLAVCERDYRLLQVLYDKLPTNRFNYYLCEKGELQHIKFCIEKDANFINKMLQEYPLHVCAQFNHPHLCLHLLECGADINKTRGLYMETPLHVACNNRNEKLVKILCENEKIEINKCNSMKESALHVACKSYRQFNIVKILLNTSIDLNLLDQCGDSAFSNACANNADRTVTLLWSQRAQLNLHVDDNNEHIRNFKKEHPELFQN